MRAELTGKGPRRGEALTKYDPERGLKTIAAAEAVEKHWARAKDPERLTQAIRAKLTAQAEFVEWWDHVAEKDRGGGSPRTHNRSVKGDRLGKNGLPDPMIVSRWRRKLGPDQFEATYEAAVEKYRAILELEHAVHVGQATGDFEWYSPAEYVEAARFVLGDIDLDPASTKIANDKVIKAAQYFTRKDQPLEQLWHGRVWMNPPYGAGVVDAFAAKLVEERKAGRVDAAVVLVNNATETDWFQALAGIASAFCFPRGRLKFWRPGAAADSVPLQGQAVIYCGDAAAGFCAAFQGFGLALAPYDREVHYVR